VGERRERARGEVEIGVDEEQKEGRKRGKERKEKELFLSFVHLRRFFFLLRSLKTRGRDEREGKGRQWSG
jgi:hypothetical protein